MFLISYFCKDFRNLFAIQTYDNLSKSFILGLPPPPSQSVSKAKFTRRLTHIHAANLKHI